MDRQPQSPHGHSSTGSSKPGCLSSRKLTGPPNKTWPQLHQRPWLSCISCRTKTQKSIVTIDVLSMAHITSTGLLPSTASMACPISNAVFLLHTFIPFTAWRSARLRKQRRGRANSRRRKLSCGSSSLSAKGCR